jgi:hypothetical protein
MPRVASFQTLAAAISDGTANMNWAQETFGYAEAHDGEKWVGVLTGAHLVPNRSGLLIHPDHVPDPTGGTGENGGTGGTGGGENGGTGGTGGGETGEAATRFYAQFRLDSVRAIRHLGEILEDVASHLGPDLELELEVRAKNEDGYDEATRRIVSENARHHGSKGAEFE